MSARKDRENWERFRDDWENNRIVVHVDPFKAMDAWEKRRYAYARAYGLVFRAPLYSGLFDPCLLLFLVGDSAWADRFSRLPLYIPASAREGYDPRDARG